MASPSPTSPTINDLLYAQFDAAGNVRVTTGQTFVAGVTTSDSVRTSENVVLDLVGNTYTVNTSDFLNTAENTQLGLDPTGPNQYSIAVSDSTTTSENVVATEA